MKNFVYTAGPIEDCTVEEMTGWRQRAASYLGERNILVKDPTRRLSFHVQLGDKDLVQEKFKDRSLNISKRIFKQDLEDIHMSKVVLADVRRSAGKGTGTACELMFAHMNNKIIILWQDKDDYPHPFLTAMATEIHYDLECALAAVRSYF